MSRYVDKQPTVSQEGFFGAVGKFLAAAGTAYSRSVTLGQLTGRVIIALRLMVYRKRISNKC